jgi:hypothetical protein
VPKVSKSARVSIRAGAVWRNCSICGVLMALPPVVECCEECAKVARLRDLAEFFGPDDKAMISWAGCIFAGAIQEIAHHEIGDPGSWDCYGSTIDELIRLRTALGRMQDAIRRTQAELEFVEQNARDRANGVTPGGEG